MSIQRSHARSGAALAASVLLALVAGCSSGSGAGSQAIKTDNEIQQPNYGSDSERQALIEATFGQIDDAAMQPPVLETMKVASAPLSEAQKQMVLDCIAKGPQATCTLGDGQLIVGVAEGSAQIPFRKLQRAAYIDQAIRYPDIGKIIFTDADGDLQTFLSNFRSLISQKVSMITGQMDFGGAMLQVTKQAARAGIPVVSNLQSIEGAELGKDAWEVATNSCGDLGSIQAARAIEILKEQGRDEGKVAFFSGIPGNSCAAVWQPAAEKAFKDAGWSVVGKYNTQWTPQGVEQATTALIASGSNPDAIIYDDDLQLLIKKYVSLDKAPPTLLASGAYAGYYQAWRDAVDAGHPFEAFSTPGPVSAARLSITAGMMLLSGAEVEGSVDVPISSVSMASLESQFDPRLPSTSNLGSTLPLDLVLAALNS